MSEKELTLKQIEEALEKIGIPEYPKYLGGGLWKLSENCITNQQGYEEFIEKFKEELKKDDKKQYMNVSSKIREDGEISWLKNMYKQLKNKDSFNEDDIDRYKELLGHSSQDVDTLED